MPDSIGDAAQIRKIGEQIAEATIIKMREVERPKVEIPAPLKWIGAIAAAVMTAGVTGLCYWLVGTLNEVQLAVREVSTQLSVKGSIEQRFMSIEQRITNLERQQQEPRK